MLVRLMVVLRLSLKKAPAERAIQDQGLPIEASGRAGTHRNSQGRLHVEYAVG